MFAALRLPLSHVLRLEVEGLAPVHGFLYARNLLVLLIYLDLHQHTVDRFRGDLISLHRRKYVSCMVLKQDKNVKFNGLTSKISDLVL